MPRFEPFAGLRYAPGTDHESVTAPPYDVIDPVQRAELAARSEANAVRFDLPDEADGPGRYEAAALLLAQLREKGVLVTDSEPSLYVYRMTYVDETGRPRHTTGVVGALALSRPGEGGILPHEHTTPKAKSDRLDLLRATAHNLSPIWGLSLTPGLTSACRTDRPADAACADEEGVRHELWRIVDGRVLDAVTSAVASSPVVIADGHHRYETSLAYRDEMRARHGSGPWDLTMTYVVELSDDELAVRAIHRLLRGTPSGPDLLASLTAEHFDAEPTSADRLLPERMRAGGALALVLPGGAYLLRPRPGAFANDLPDLDSSRLDAALTALPELTVEYQHGAATVLRRVGAGEADAGVLLRPATIDQIAATAHGGARMPPKTTFFWPKPRTGFVFRSLA